MGSETHVRNMVAFTDMGYEEGVSCYHIDGEVPDEDEFIDTHECVGFFPGGTYPETRLIFTSCQDSNNLDEKFFREICRKILNIQLPRKFSGEVWNNLLIQDELTQYLTPPDAPSTVVVFGTRQSTGNPVTLLYTENDISLYKASQLLHSAVLDLLYRDN
jgi:hypothetical protein